MTSNGRKPREFHDEEATRQPGALLIGIVGPSSSGKTFSALRLATGIQRVSGGEIWCIDTENKRATHYADKFKFRHVDMQPPFGPLDYLDAFQYCIARGARVIVCDSTTHEHAGEGGVMDQSDKYLDRTCGNDFGKRKSMFMLSLVEPKKQRKKLNAFLARLRDVHVILCYRAQEKTKPVKGDEPIKLGWQPDTTSTLHYEMTQRFLLGPGSDGVPTLSPEHAAERLLIKNPAQFRGWFKQGEPLSEELGERMARWAVAEGVTQSQSGAAPVTAPSFHWKSNAEWNGKPLAIAPLDVLREYRDVIDDAFGKAAKPEVKRSLNVWAQEATRAIEDAEAEVALGGDQSDEPNGDGEFTQEAANG